MIHELKSMIGKNETILYEGKPDKKCFVYESIFNPMLPFALLWGAFDLFALFGGLSNSSSASGTTSPSLFLIFFFAFHLLPVWLYLGGVMLTWKKYKNTYYIVTDYAVYVSSGAFNTHLKTKPFTEMSSIHIHRGRFDLKFGVGDILISTSEYDPKGRPLKIEIASIKNYQKVYELVKKLQTDIYSDIQYPNDLRPKENHGYQTKHMNR